MNEPLIVSSREALARVIYEYRKSPGSQLTWDTESTPWGGDRLPVKHVEAYHMADALLASGIIRDASTLADDETLVETVGGQLFAAQSASLDGMARAAIRALATALKDQTR